MSRRFVPAAVATAIFLVQGVSAQRIKTEELLARAEAYVRVFVDQFANMVAEERYVQDSKTFPRKRPRGSTGTRLLATGLARHVELVSDYLLARSKESRLVFGFRDVYSVNGVPVRDREERLMKLFTQPSDTMLQEAERIATESARYTLGGETRTLNNPILAVGFLQSIYQPRFRFSLSGSDAEIGKDVWVVEYKDDSRPTVLRRLPDTDLVAKGRLWIEGATGRVLKTELSAGELDTVVVTFRYDDRFKIAVPVEMREDFWVGNEVVSGVATYGRFRQFNVSTEEKFQPPSDQPEK